MKRLFSLFAILLIAVMAFTASSCRSVKESTISTTERHHVSKEADTLAHIVKADAIDSTGYYHNLVDSLIKELHTIKERYRELYVKDSTFVNQYRVDSISVRDSSWSVTNADGSTTHYKNTQKEKYTYQQLDKYKESILKDRQREIDSLINESNSIRQRYDSIYNAYIVYDRLFHYSVVQDSTTNETSQNDATTIVKDKTWFEQLKDKVGGFTLAMILAAIIALIVHFIFKFKKL